MPAKRVPSSRLNEGATAASVTIEVAVPLAVVTTTGTEPVDVSFGTCKLTWVGPTNQRYAGFPSTVTLVPPRIIGKFPFHVTDEPARFVPQIEIHSPDCIVVAVL
jgi:hypothetical protein